MVSEPGVAEGPAGRVVGIEIKSGSSVGDRDFRGLKKLREVAGDRFHRGLILYTGHETLPFDENLYAVPTESMWRTGSATHD